MRRNGTWPNWSRSVSDDRLKMRSATAVAPNWTTSLRPTNVGCEIVRPFTVSGLAALGTGTSCTVRSGNTAIESWWRDTVVSSMCTAHSVPRPTSCVPGSSTNERPASGPAVTSQLTDSARSGVSPSSAP